jgi:SAM-dependent methyltransferase
MEKIMNRDGLNWNLTAGKTPVGQDFDELMAEQYRQALFGLLSGWVDLSGAQAILKTDLFAEALCPQRAFLGDILQKNSNVTAVDISSDICVKASETTKRNFPGYRPKFIACDVRCLPFADRSFDLVVSDSTLDHFKYRADINIALGEIKRVLKPGGVLVITMDNKSNITEPLFRLWIFLGLAPYFIGRTYSMKELKQALENTGLCVQAQRALVHNPRFFTKAIVAMIRRQRGAKGSAQIRKMLKFLDSLEKRKTRFLTAQFIAARAVKP